MMPYEESSDREASRPCRGLAASELSVGRLVTISVNKITGDRSLCQVIWEVASTNDGHALVKCRHLRHLLYGTPETRLVPLHEHEFYAADELALALGSERDTLN